jgi:hypothetical protein
METPTDNSRHHLNRAESAKDSALPQGSSPRFDLDKILEEITRSAQHLTGADGAALALSDGNAISCRTCSGYLTPPVGTRLNIHTGLTATCLQTAEVVHCDDTHTDPRVDRSNCVAIRSILAVPLFDGPNVAGVLEVFSSKPKSFTDKHVKTLQLLARLVETQVNQVSPANVPLATSASDAKPTTSDPGASKSYAPRVGCLSCGQRNPQGSQFCNRCGVILCSSPDPLERTSDLNLADGMQPLDREGLREVYKLIAGDTGRATWSEIYANLLANQKSPCATDKPTAATTGEATRKKDALKGFETATAKKELTA